MGIDGITNVTSPNYVRALSNPTPTQKTGESTTSVIFERSKGSTDKKEYHADISRMREIWTEHDRQVAAFQRLVDGLLQRQAEEAKKSGIEWNFTDPNAMVDIDEETRAAAKESIEEGGYFSVDKTAARLLDFAVAISGGDPDKIELLRGAVTRGFESAESQWGDKLPEICRQTLDSVTNGFDEWAKNGSTSDITLLKSQK